MNTTATLQLFLRHVAADRGLHLSLFGFGCAWPLFWLVLFLAMVETWQRCAWRAELNRRRAVLREYPMLRKPLAK